MLIIGCGNPDRGDDAAGVLVARELRKIGVAALEHSGDAFGLIELWKDASTVILVDAVVSGGIPGAVYEWDELPPDTSFRCSTHDFGPAEAIRLSAATGSLPARLKIFGIEAGSCEPGSEVSAPVRSAAGEVARRIALEANLCTNRP